MPDPLTIVVCRDRVARDEATRLQTALIEGLRGWPSVTVKVLPHLYDLALGGAGAAYLQSVTGDLAVLAWLYPRAAYWILDAHGVRGRIGHTCFFPDDELTPAIGPPPSGDVPARTIWCFDLRPHRQAAPLLSEIERIVLERGGEPLPRAAVAAPANGHGKVDESTRPRWYPVVDRTRCKNCLECLNFCLFGVFGLGMKGDLLVEQPDACRNGCPACARVCPSGAIMFPEHENGAIAGDAQARPDDVNRDLFQLFGLLTPAQAAAADRQRVLGEELPPPAEPPQTSAPGKATQPAATDHPLDKLVDELDQSDL